MTDEFGPREGRAGLLGRVFGLSVQALLVVFSAINTSDPRVRYDRQRATLSFSGESEYSGDAFRRGQGVMAVVTGGVLLPPAALMGSTMVMNAVAETVSTAAATPFALLSLGLMVFSLVCLSGLWSVGDEISVVDHTTEPAPDELDEVKRRYQNGEIDEDELEREAAEVWER